LPWAVICLTTLSIGVLAATAPAATPVYKGTVGPGFTIKLAKPPTKPVGRDSDASPGQGTQPPQTPNRVDPLDSSARSGTPSGGEVDDPDDRDAGAEGGAARVS